MSAHFERMMEWLDFPRIILSGGSNVSEDADA
jgi:hypothetical protein